MYVYIYIYIYIYINQISNIYKYISNYLLLKVSRFHDHQVNKFSLLQEYYVGI